MKFKFKKINFKQINMKNLLKRNTIIIGVTSLGSIAAIGTTLGVQLSQKPIVDKVNTNDENNEASKASVGLITFMGKKGLADYTKEDWDQFSEKLKSDQNLNFYMNIGLGMIKNKKTKEKIKTIIKNILASPKILVDVLKVVLNKGVLNFDKEDVANVDKLLFLLGLEKYRVFVKPALILLQKGLNEATKRYPDLLYTLLDALGVKIEDGLKNALNVLLLHGLNPLNKTALTKENGKVSAEDKERHIKEVISSSLYGILSSAIKLPKSLKVQGVLNLNIKKIIKSALPLLVDKILTPFKDTYKLDDLIEKEAKLKIQISGNKDNKANREELINEYSLVKNRITIVKFEMDNHITKEEILKNGIFHGKGIAQLSEKELTEFFLSFQKLLIDFPEVFNDVIKNVDTGDSLIKQLQQAAFTDDNITAFLKNIKQVQDIQSNPIIRKIANLNLKKIAHVIYTLSSSGIRKLTMDHIKSTFEVVKEFTTVPILDKIEKIKDEDFKTILKILSKGVFYKGSTKDGTKMLIKSIVSALGLKLDEKIINIIMEVLYEGLDLKKILKMFKP